jgi:hypothetical protein
MRAADPCCGVYIDVINIVSSGKVADDVLIVERTHWDTVRRYKFGGEHVSPAAATDVLPGTQDAITTVSFQNHRNWDIIVSADG